MTSALTLAGLLGALVAMAWWWRALAAGPAPGGDALEAFGGALVLDRFGLAVGAVVVLGALVAALAATDSMARRGLALGECQALLLFATTGALLLVAAGDLLTLFLGLEVMSLGAYTLTAAHRTSVRGGEGALKYFLLGAFASGFLLYGVACAYGATGSLRVAALAEAAGGAPGADATLARVAVAMLLVGLAFKVGVAPFHQWVADAYDGAPAAVSAFMATAVKVAAFGALARVAVAALRGPEAAALFQALAVATMVTGNVMALGQRVLKRLLAWSSVAHAGYALIALAALAQGHGGQPAVQALTVYLLTYTVASLGAFGVVAALEPTDGTPLELVDCRGLSQRRPVLAAVLTLCLLSLAGLPPLAGFFGKYLTFLAAVQVGLWPLALVGVAASLLGLVYYVRVPLLCYTPTQADGTPAGAAGGAAPTSAWMRFALAIAVVGTVWLGMGPSWRPLLPGLSDVLRWSAQAAAALFAG